MRRIITRIGQGLGIGTAPLVPGVSAATIALIMGVYEKLITELAALVRLPRSFADLKENLNRDWATLIPLLAGIIGAIAFGTLIIPPLVDAQPLAIFSVFSGLIAASAVVLARRVHGGKSGYLWMVLGVAIGISAALAPVSIEATVTAPGIMLAGALAIAAMLLPGVSGSYVLLLAGYYTHVLGALRTLDVGFLALFALGGVAGAIISIRGIRTLLERYHTPTMLVLIGIIAGALGKPLGIAIAAVTSGLDVLALIGWFVIGAIITVLISR